MKIKLHKNIIVIIAEAIFLVIVFGIIYILYPRVSVNVKGDFVNIKSFSGNVIIISENPDFTNPRYIELSKGKNQSFNLEPGVYYYKSDNGIISGVKNKFEIKSLVGLDLNKSNNETSLVNVGNVKINVTKGKGGSMVGHIILEPTDSERVDDNLDYVGREEK